MPLNTFFNLSEEKKQTLETILLDTFFEKPVSQVKVSEIVRKMNMSRGAFYQYFSDLEDAYTYIIQKCALVIHQDIMVYIEKDQSHFFDGIEKYLIWCSQLEEDSQYLKSIQLLTKSNDLSAYKRPPFSEDSPMTNEWITILNASGLTINDKKEAISFLFFIMDLVMNSLAAFIANKWSTEELVTDYRYRVKWVTRGLAIKNTNQE